MSSFNERGNVKTRVKIPDGYIQIRQTVCGQLISETYWHCVRKGQSTNECIHREDGPAMTAYNKDGSIARLHYKHYGKLHRRCGPALVNNDTNTTRWFKHGRDIQHIVDDLATQGILPGTVVFDFTFDLL